MYARKYTECLMKKGQYSEKWDQSSWANVSHILNDGFQDFRIKMLVYTFYIPNVPVYEKLNVQNYC